MILFDNLINLYKKRFENKKNVVSYSKISYINKVTVMKKEIL